MGRAKQLLEWRGRPLLQYVVDVAAAGAGRQRPGGGPRGRGRPRRPGPARVGPGGGERRRGRGPVDVPARRPGRRWAPTPPPPWCSSATSRRCGPTPSGPSPSMPAMVARASYGGRPGHPVRLDRAVWREVRALTGDAGARELLRRRPEWLVEVEVGGDPAAGRRHSGGLRASHEVKPAVETAGIRGPGPNAWSRAGVPPGPSARPARGATSDSPTLSSPNSEARP